MYILIDDIGRPELLSLKNDYPKNVVVNVTLVSAETADIINKIQELLTMKHYFYDGHEIPACPICGKKPTANTISEGETKFIKLNCCEINNDGGYNKIAIACDNWRVACYKYTNARKF